MSDSALNINIVLNLVAAICIIRREKRNTLHAKYKFHKINGESCFGFVKRVDYHWAAAILSEPRNVSRIP